MTAHFDPNMYLRHITLVGCGGTGSLLARFIARMLWDMKQRRMHLPDVTFIDFDKIEVARGPQGTLDGDPNLSGSIHIERTRIGARISRFI